MQYLLTQDEYDNFVPLEEVANRDKALEKLRRMIVPDEECCVINTKLYRYCDSCSLSTIRNRDGNYHVEKLICNRKQRYSK